MFRAIILLLYSFRRDSFRSSKITITVRLFQKVEETLELPICQYDNWRVQFLIELETYTDKKCAYVHSTNCNIVSLKATIPKSCQSIKNFFTVGLRTIAILRLLDFSFTYSLLIVLPRFIMISDGVHCTLCGFWSFWRTVKFVATTCKIKRIQLLRIIFIWQSHLQPENSHYLNNEINIGGITDSSFK